MKRGNGKFVVVLPTNKLPLEEQNFSLVSTTRFKTRSTGDWFATGATQHMSDQKEIGEPSPISPPSPTARGSSEGLDRPITQLPSTKTNSSGRTPTE